MNDQWDVLWTDVNIATMCEGTNDYGAIEDAAIAVADGRIVWLGKAADLPGPADEAAGVVHSGSGKWLTPGLIDCHTHIVYGGNRAREFEMRLQGATYEELQKPAAVSCQRSKRPVLHQRRS